jgi:hypothetical protein
MLLWAVCASAHDGYQDWVNRRGQGCCNDRDCRPLRAEHLRVERGRLEALVRGVGSAAGQIEWCPIEAHHYLRRGNAPDPSSAHICVTAHYGGKSPCAQLVCFQPAVQF